MVARISTFGLYNMINANNLSVQARIGDLSNQSASGLKSVDYKGISSNAKTLTALEGELSAAQTYQDNVDIAENKFNIQLSMVNLLLERAESFKVDIAASLGVPSDASTDAAYVAIAQADYDDFVQTLNTRSGGQYLFAGTAWDVQPVDITDPGYAGPVTPPSAANTAYYQGDAGNSFIPIGDGVSVDTSIPGNQSAFEEALRAFRLIVDNPGDGVARQEAFSLIESAIDGLALIRSEISANANSASRQRDILAERESFISEAISDIRDADVAQVALESQQLSTQLEASYSVTTRLLRLSLVDFVR